MFKRIFKKKKTNSGSRSPRTLSSRPTQRRYVTDDEPKEYDPSINIGGLRYEVVKEELEIRRKGQLNILAKDIVITENFVNSMKINSIFGKESFADLAAIAKVSAVKGCANSKLGPSQDDSIIFTDTIDNKIVNVLAMFDGHGISGEKVAQSCSLLLEDLIKLEKCTFSETREPIKIKKTVVNPPKRDLLLLDEKKYFSETFDYLHQSVCTANDFSSETSGSTGTIAYFINKKLTLSWVGDTQAALFTTNDELFNNFLPIFITSKHNFLSKEETKRISDFGGRLGYANNLDKAYDPCYNKPVRFFYGLGENRPGLAVSKAIGDQKAHEYGISYKPSQISFNFDKIKTYEDLEDIVPKEYNMTDEEKFEIRLHLKRQEYIKNKKNNKNKMQFSSYETATEDDVDDDEQVEEDKEEIVQVDLKEKLRKKKIKHTLLIIATDGFWDVLTKEQVAEALPKLMEEKLSKKSTMENISLDLVMLAIEKFRIKNKNPYVQTDDISVIAYLLF